MIIVLLLLFSLLYASVFIYFDHDRSLFLTSYLRQLDYEFHMTRELYGRLAEAMFNLQIDTLQVKELFAAGMKEQNLERKNGKRQELYEALLPLFQQLQHAQFRQLHFHERDNTSYLRMHRPSTFGDDLTGIRTSVELVNRTKAPVSGFEEGRIYNGYRYVYPLFLDDEYLGSVELSVSMNTVLSTYKSIYGHDMQFILSREQMEKKVFDQEQGNYVDWEISSDFVLDKELSENNLFGYRVPLETARRIDKALRKHRAEGLPFAVFLKLQGVYQLITFLPIKNFEEKTVAYIFSLDEAEKLKALRANFFIVILILTVLFMSTAGFTGYVFYSRNRIRKLARIDYLTRVPTRSVVYEEIEKEINRFRRYGKAFAVMIIDVDHFKKVNDTHGHVVGDKVLRKIAEILNLNVRSTDSLGRFGGEEFLVLLPETTLAQALAAAGNLRSAIEAHLFEDAGWVTISIGVSQMEEKFSSSEQLVEQADKSLYKAKEQGRNRVIAL